jgi:hypothetical protein
MIAVVKIPEGCASACYISNIITFVESSHNSKSELVVTLELLVILRA